MNVPALRFPEFDGEWDQPQLSELFPKVRNGFVGTATPFYDQAGIAYLQGKNIKSGAIDPKGLIRVNRFFHDKQKKSQLKTGDLLMVQSGHVGECAVVTSEFDGANCHALVVMTPTKEVEPQFIRDLFYAPAGQKQIHKIKTGNTIEHVLTSDLKPLVLPVPSLPEQKKIAAFLGVVDARIAALRARVAGLERYKRGLMQALFSQTLRFTKPDGSAFPDWEEKRLGEVCSFFKGKGIAKADITEDGSLSCIRYGELYTQYSEIIPNALSKTDVPETQLFLSELDDVIIPASGEDRLDMARASCVKQGGVALGGDLNVLRSEVNGEFLAYYLSNAKRKDIARFAQGNSVVHLYGTQLKILDVTFPHPNEQAKIAEALQAMDAKIAAVTDQLARMQDFKKGLLQQMFV